MDIKKVTMDMWAKGKAYATEHRYEIAAAVRDVSFGIAMAGVGYLTGIATENQRILYNQQLIEYREAGNYDKLTDGRMYKNYGEYAKTKNDEK